jgi:peroxiredoxin
MCRTLTALVAVLFVATAVTADDPKDKPKDKPSEVAAKFEPLQKQYLDALDARELLERSGKHAEAEAGWERSKAAALLPKMLELAFFNPSDPASFDVLRFVTVNGASDEYLWDQVMVLLRRDDADNPKMKHIVRLLTKRNDETADLLRAVIAKNPDKKTAAQACRLLLDHVGDEAKMAEEISDKLYLQPLFERRTSADYLKRVLIDLEKNKKEAKEITDLLADKYKGILPDLSEGKPLPDFTVEDLAGKKVKLSDLRGKLVVLSVLSTRDNNAALIADHQRELAKKYEGKPLVLVNVFVDEKKDAVTEFLKKHQTPGTNSWGGPKNNLLEDWELPKTPATFILDAKGDIRYRDRYRAALDDVLPDLVKEAEKK